MVLTLAPILIGIGHSYGVEAWRTVGSGESRRVRVGVRVRG
jgi:hypothetical protein